MLSRQEDQQLLESLHLWGGRDSLVHAYLCEGQPEAVDRLADALARRILFDFGGAAEKRGGVRESADFLRIEDPKIRIDRLRQVNYRLYQRPLEGQYKLIYLRHGGEMTQEVQNLLLKPLEEPPAYAVWLLGTDNASKFLPTIRSRCRLVRLAKPLPEMGGQDKLILWINQALQGKGAEAFSWAKPFEEWKEDKNQIFISISLYLRLILEYKMRGGWEEGAEEDSGLRQAVEEVAPLVTLGQLGKAIDETEAIRQLLEVNINFDLAMEHLLLSMGE